MLETATTIEVVGDRPEQVGAAPPPTHPRDRWPRWIGVAGVATLAVPIVAVVFVALTRTWLPPSDHALIQIRTMDVGGSATPLLGSYSRLGWNHPGPLEFWLLALPYRLFGGTSEGMLIGAVLINAVSLGGCLVVARRRGGAVLTLLVGLALAALVRGFGAAYLFHIWNPDLPAFPTAFLILATWAVIEGDVRLLPVVVATSCFTWQTHIGYLPVSGGLAAIALVAGGVHLLRARHRPGAAAADASGGFGRPWLLVGATVVTAIVCLAPLAVDQATVEPGNLQMIINSFRHPQEEVAGFATAARIAAQYLAPGGTWITGDAPAEPFTAAATGTSPAWLFVPALAVIGAAMLAARAGAADALRFLTVTSTAAALAIVAVSRTTGDPYNYLFNWLRPVSALLWVSVGWAVHRWARSSAIAPRLDRATVRYSAVVVTAIATMALSVSSLSNGVALEFHENTPAVELQALVPGTLAAVAGQERVYLRSVGGWCAGELGQGLALQLIEHGTDVAVADELAPRFGRERVRHDVTPTVELFCGPVAKDAIAKLPMRPVAEHNILSDAEALELVALQQRFRRRLAEIGHPGFLPNVDNQSFPTVVELYLPDSGFDRRDVDRFDTLMTQAQHSSSVFYRPFGPNSPT